MAIIGKRKDIVPVNRNLTSSYQYLSDFATGCLMQDYDIFGETPGEVLLYAKGILKPQKIGKFKSSIVEFFADHEELNDPDFSLVYRQRFYPTVTLEGWEGKSTRQWLREFHQMLSLPKAESGE